MSRAFISLYGFIVASVLLIGWGLNQFWEKLAPEQKPSAEIHALFELIEQQLLPLADLAAREQKTRQLSAQLAIRINLLPLDDLAQSAALAQLRAGELLASVASASDTTATTITWYKRLGDSNQVVLLNLPIHDERESPWQKLLLLVFYVAIALVIYLWVWPLSRDSKKLEVQTRALGKDGVPQTLNISPASTLYPLAQAFNHMAQRLRALIASHREMTNAVSHELRTPLARMKFALAMLDDTQRSDKERRHLHSLAQDIGEMEALISALLAYAGFEQNSQQLQQTPGQMRDLLEELQLRFTRQMASQARVPLTLEICDFTHNAEFFCEWKLMETVLQNLIHNGARYAKSRIRIELRQTPGEYIIAIEDDGLGIPADKRERVFESFVRLYHDTDTTDHQNASTSNSGSATGGFGLGLAIVKRIMQWHNGRAEFVEPQHLGGARAVLRWPKMPT